MIRRGIRMNCSVRTPLYLGLFPPHRDISGPSNAGASSPAIAASHCACAPRRRWVVEGGLSLGCYRTRHPDSDARKAFRQVDAEKAMTEHEIAQKAFSKNRERLRAERLAREAAGTPVAAKKAKPKKKFK
jgi:hypothetical protein